METAAFTVLIVSSSASPLKPSSRVLPWIVSMATPVCSAMPAMASAFLCSLSQPVRILSVTGTETAAHTASRIRATNASSFMSALPHAV